MSVENWVVNGEFAVSQLGTSVPKLVHLDHVGDRWLYGQQGAGSVLRWDLDPDVPDPSVPASSRLTVVQAAPVAADQEKHIRYGVEGRDFRALCRSQATLSFLVKASVPGVYCVAFTCSGRDRTYVAEYAITEPDTWEQQVIVVPFCDVTGGAWDYGTGLGIGIRFALASGSKYHGQPDQWNAANVTSTARQTDLGATAGASFRLAMVQLTPGSTRLSFLHRPPADTFRLCTRYLYVLTKDGARRTPPSSVTTPTVAEIYVPLPQRLRVPPRVSIIGAAGVDWMLRSGADATAAAPGTLLTNPTWGREQGLVRFEGGSFTPGTPLHVLLVNDVARIVFDAEII